MRKVRVLMNPKAGLPSSCVEVMEAIAKAWDAPGTDLTFQLSRSVEDGQAKARRAVEDGADTVMVVGGDGMVNSIGSELMGTETALAVIPTGSGNGFARHFEIPLDPEEAATALASGKRLAIDVGTANDRPFFVTCSMAWDAAIVRSFEKSPIRGILPYVFAAVYEYFEYTRQPFEATIDGRQRRTFKDPLLFTAANLTQYGGGLQIAPLACPDDGFLELIVIDRKDAPRALAKLPKFFDGTVLSVPEVQSFKFKTLTVLRALPAAIQVDGELVESPAEVKIGLKPRALNVLVPRSVEADS